MNIHENQQKSLKFIKFLENTYNYTVKALKQLNNQIKPEILKFPKFRNTPWNFMNIHENQQKALKIIKFLENTYISTV